MCETGMGQQVAQLHRR